MLQGLELGILTALALRDEAQPLSQHLAGILVAPGLNQSFNQLLLRFAQNDVAGALAARANALGRPPTPADVERITWLWVTRCQERSGQEMAKTIGTTQVARHLGRFFERFDVLLKPTCATPPLPLWCIDMRSNDLDNYYDRLYDNNTFTTLYNCTGVPAVSVPLVWADGLPIGGVPDGAARLALAKYQPPVANTERSLIKPGMM